MDIWYRPVEIIENWIFFHPNNIFQKESEAWDWIERQGKWEFTILKVIIN